SVSLAVHHNGVGAAVDDFKINAHKGGIALWYGTSLAVLLFNVNTAPDYLVFGFVLQHLSVLQYGDGNLFVKGLQHRIIGRDLPDGVLAVGKRVLASGGHARRVGGDGHGSLPGGGSVAVHHNRVGAIVDDIERNPLQAGIA